MSSASRASQIAFWYCHDARQTERIGSVAERDGLKIVESIEEMDVSGGATLVSVAT